MLVIVYGNVILMNISMEPNQPSSKRSSGSNGIGNYRTFNTIFHFYRLSLCQKPLQTTIIELKVCNWCGQCDSSVQCSINQCEQRRTFNRKLSMWYSILLSPSIWWKRFHHFFFSDEYFFELILLCVYYNLMFIIEMTA